MATPPSVKRSLSLKGVDAFQLLGTNDAYLRFVQEACGSTIVARGDALTISGDAATADTTEKIFMEMIFLLNRNGRLSMEDVKTVVDMIQAGDAKASKGVDPELMVLFYGKKGIIQPRSAGQRAYAASVLSNDIVFAVGPAGTGKTYLAVAMALEALREKDVSRIVLTRPAIEAGENLGFLPGDMMDKVDPYLRPLTDALFDMLPSDQLQKCVDRKIIEVVPLAYMRGRTLNDAFVILDEAQNTTPIQMKMFLTRLGMQSKAIITGDDTQIDLPDPSASGLVEIQEILKEIEGIGFVHLDKADVVRHRLVKAIIQAYDDFDGNDK